MALRSKPLFCAVVMGASLGLATAGYAGHHEGAEQSASEAGSALSEKAKQAGAKGASTGTDSLMKGSTVEDSAKKGGAAAVDEALRPAAVPEMPAIPGAVSAPSAD